MRPSFWHDRWRDGRIGFHRTEPNPALTEWWGRVGCKPEGAVLVPLCGKSVDMHWLARAGNSVAGVDISPVAIDAFWSEAQLTPTLSRIDEYSKTSAERVSLLQGSFFNVEPAHLPELSAFYDRAAIIALPPELQPHYAFALSRVVPAGTQGLMITVEYDQAEIDGPPFSTSPDRVRSLLGDTFEVEVLVSRDAYDRASHLAERGLTALQEHVLLLTRK